MIYRSNKDPASKITLNIFKQILQRWIITQKFDRELYWKSRGREMHYFLLFFYFLIFLITNHKSCIFRGPDYLPWLLVFGRHLLWFFSDIIGLFSLILAHTVSIFLYFIFAICLLITQRFDRGLARKFLTHI